MWHFRASIQSSLGILTIKSSQMTASWHYYAPVVSLLDHHRCLGAPEGLGLCGGLRQKRHLSLLVGIILKEHQLSATCMETLSFCVTAISCFTYSSHPCLDSVKVWECSWVTASALCSPLMTKALFLGQACHDSFLPSGKALSSVPRAKRLLTGCRANSQNSPERMNASFRTHHRLLDSSTATHSPLPCLYRVST